MEQELVFSDKEISDLKALAKRYNSEVSFVSKDNLDIELYVYQRNKRSYDQDWYTFARAYVSKYEENLYFVSYELLIKNRDEQEPDAIEEDLEFEVSAKDAKKIFEKLQKDIAKIDDDISGADRY